jgi:CO/xanthine dehydrogenase FAD-binding subunit
MKPPPFQYHDPRTLAEVVGLLGTLDNAKLLAGGQSLMPMLNMRFVLPDHVIDLNRRPSARCCTRRSSSPATARPATAAPSAARFAIWIPPPSR